MKKVILSTAIRPVALGCLLLLPTLSWADSAPLAADAFINPGDASNYGVLPTINVGGAANSQGLLQFNLGSLAGGTVAWARLHVYVNSVTTPGAVDLGTASASWSETSVNGLGGPGVLVPIATAVPISGPGYLTFDVTTQVAAWLANSAVNNGFILTPNGVTPGVTVFFDAKESPATSHPATLEIVFTGPAGATGAQGAQGPTGPTGVLGVPGAAGLPGAAGPPGAPGPAGPTGAAGATGPTGAVGAAGAPGALGPAGPTGAKGATGATGPIGVNGPAGPTGAAGLAGPAGPTGSAGPQGATGPGGVTGPGFSNILNLDTTVHSGTFTIPNGTTVTAFLTTEGSTITLPTAASSTGKKIWIIPTNPTGAPTFTIQRQGTDLIFWSQIATDTSIGLTSIANSNPVQVVSSGTYWYVTYINH